jgi:hypothetical protein
MNFDEHSCTANRGYVCEHETHLFRIGREIPDSIEFRAELDNFYGKLEGAIIQHGIQHGKSNHLNIQVMTDASWRQIQNPETGGVMAITPEIAGQTDTANQLFCWACNSVQMARDLTMMADNIADSANE